MQVFESENLQNRIGHVHLKDCYADDPETWNYRTQRFGEQARFAELGAGNLGLDVKAALEGLEAVGYDGWGLCRTRPSLSAASTCRSCSRKS